jgi:hypothetical protein
VLGEEREGDGEIAPAASHIAKIPPVPRGTRTSGDDRSDCLSARAVPETDVARGLTLAPAERDVSVVPIVCPSVHSGGLDLAQSFDAR